jgi:spoIIIJ-associated protein
VYDPQLEAHEFVGDDRRDAVAKATVFFGTPEAELAIVDVKESQISGLGARFVVVARRRDAVGRRPERGERRERDREPREAREGRGRREPRRGRERRDDRREARPTAPEPSEPSKPSEATVSGELSEIGEFVKGVVLRMDVGSFEISESRETDDLVVVQLKGEASQGLTGGEGRAADAIQLLANQALLRSGTEEVRRVVIDVEGDLEKREKVLARVAERAAQRARESGRPVALEAMNAKDRRSIHVALREAEGVATMSVGEGRYRQVVVVPEGSPEYEEALRQEGP